MSLKGKTAIVTGGSRGIGRAIAETLAERGASVVVNYTASSAAASEVAKAITKAGGKAIAVQADVSKPADVKRLFAEAEKAFGKPAIVVANAGVYVQKAIADTTGGLRQYFQRKRQGNFLHAPRSGAPGSGRRPHRGHLHRRYQAVHGGGGCPLW